MRRDRYERSHIEKWLQEHNTSPKTNETLAHKHLNPSHAIRAQIRTFLDNCKAAGIDTASF